MTTTYTVRWTASGPSPSRDITDLVASDTERRGGRLVRAECGPDRKEWTLVDLSRADALTIARSIYIALHSGPVVLVEVTVGQGDRFMVETTIPISTETRVST